MATGAAPATSAVVLGDDEDAGLVHGEAVDGGTDEPAAAEEVIASSSAPADSFDEILGELEVLMMDESFNDRVDAFTALHCGEFDAGEENRLVYTTLFSEYTAMLEKFIEEQLGTSVASFDMASFCARVAERCSADEELPLPLEMLSAYSDFEAFKALMLSAKDGAALEAASGPFGVMGEQLRVRADEQEDGDAMPDLNLSISSASPTKPKPKRAPR